jgi:hypothetical protein
MSKGSVGDPDPDRIKKFEVIEDPDSSWSRNELKFGNKIHRGTDF